MPKYDVSLELEATFVMVANPTVTIEADDEEEAYSRAEDLAAELEAEFGVCPYGGGLRTELASILLDEGMNPKDPSGYELERPEKLSITVEDVSVKE